MKNDIYFEKLNEISYSASKLYSYLHVLQGYVEVEYPDNQKIANLKEILDLAVSEIDEIITKT